MCLFAKLEFIFYSIPLVVIPCIGFHNSWCPSGKVTSNRESVGESDLKQRIISKADEGTIG